MDLGTVAVGAGCLFAGALVGVVAMSVVAAGKIGDLMTAIAHEKKRAEDWHTNWRKVNNHLDAIRQACRKVSVPKRGKGGKIIGKMPVWDLVEKVARDV